MAENFNFGRIRPENQLVFCGTGQVQGLQSLDGTNNFSVNPVLHLGVGILPITETFAGQQYADANFNCLLVNRDSFYPLISEQPVNFFILRNQSDIVNNFCLLSGYLTKYTTKYYVGQAPEIQSTLRFFNNAGKLDTGSIGSYAFSQLSGIKSGFYPSYNITATPFIPDYLIPYGGSIELDINEASTNRILEYDIDISVNRIPIYNIGKRHPERVDIIYPITVLSSFTLDLGNYSGTALRDFPSNQQKQNLTIKINDYSTNLPIVNYTFSGMTLVDEKYSTSIDGNVSVIKNYVGYIFGTSEIFTQFNSNPINTNTGTNTGTQPTPTTPGIYYIAIRQDGNTGLGTNSSPWDGSTAIRMNRIIGSMSPGSLIFFDTGIFPLSGNPNGNIKSGWHISGAGSGIGKTLIRQVLSTSGPDGNIYGLISSGQTDNVILENFSFDCNLNGQSSATGISNVGVYINGINNLIQNIRVTGWGSRSNSECLPLGIGGPLSSINPYYTGASIISCIVDNPTTINITNGSTLISIGTGTTSSPKLINGLISNCIANATNYPTGAFNLYSGTNAYKMYGNNSICSNNISYNCSNGFYQDSWSNELITIQNNTFNNVTYGILLYFPSSTGNNTLGTGLFVNNTINITGNPSNPNQIAGIDCIGNIGAGTTKAIQYILISGNTIQFSDQQIYSSAASIIRPIGVFGTNSGLIINNTFNNIFPLTDNRFFTGNIVTGIGNVSNNGKIILSSNYSISVVPTGSSNG